ncbi:hydrolase [Platysternon megacephalum]|uniref:Hydrolase n=1 Tax=Platysternon megacephalum TaxID=55544 RepID=A0A4D9DBF9_9SAUR|nr:hydrolase [Platysternon megacephalum]
MNERLLALSKAGVSIWLDDLSRERLTSGNLAHLIADWSVVGVTTNPTIFAAALSKGDEYADMIAEQRAAGASVEDAVHALMVADVQEACDLFSATYEQTNGFDGRVSIEVDPTLAHDTQATLEQARALWAMVDRENALIKIPATDAGLPAITAAIAEGISVNVTLIFSLERYQQVIDAYTSISAWISSAATLWTCEVRPPSRTPAWPLSCTPRPSAATNGRTSSVLGPTSNVRCGRRRR